MRTIDDIFKEAKCCECGILDGVGFEARIFMGIKIVRDCSTGSTKILTTHNNGHYYHELSDYEYGLIFIKGWRVGVYLIKLENYKEKITVIRGKLNKLVNSKRKKHIMDLESSLMDVIERKTLITKKINHYGNISI